MLRQSCKRWLHTGSSSSPLLGRNTAKAKLASINGHQPRLSALLPPSSYRYNSSSASASSKRWQARQGKDVYTYASKAAALKSRAAFKLIEIDNKHRFFQRGQTVVDLGYAPGSWSQVAVSRVHPGAKKAGRVLGIDLIPALPPRGVSTIQGDFLNPDTRERVMDFLRDENAGKVKVNGVYLPNYARMKNKAQRYVGVDVNAPLLTVMTEKDQRDKDRGRMVDVVLSDMDQPWPLTSAWSNSVINPYRRLMNTSGNSFRDHVGSMNLCSAALSFAFDSLKTDGHFLCKFYQGGEEKVFEKRLKLLFNKVVQIKPESSHKESREAYFLGLRRKSEPSREEVFFADEAEVVAQTS